MTCRYPAFAAALAIVLASTGVGARQTPDQTARLRQRLSQATASEPDRERTHQIDKALDTLGLRPGMIVAEVGAGPGYLVEKLARRVGPGGKVYAEDIAARMLEMLKIRMADARLSNCETILGTETDPKLPTASLDMVLLHATMHFVEAPVELFRHIVPSLKPGGRLVLIEPVQGQAADPLGRPISDSRYRTREAFLDIFSKASLRVERIDATTVPFDTIFVLAPAAPGEILKDGVSPNHRDPRRFSLRGDLRPLERDATALNSTVRPGRGAKAGQPGRAAPSRSPDGRWRICAAGRRRRSRAFGQGASTASRPTEVIHRWN